MPILTGARTVSGRRSSQLSAVSCPFILTARPAAPRGGCAIPDVVDESRQAVSLQGQRELRPGKPLPPQRPPKGRIRPPPLKGRSPPRPASAPQHLPRATP